MKFIGSNWLAQIGGQLAERFSEPNGLSYIGAPVGCVAMQADVSKKSDFVCKGFARLPRVCLAPREIHFEFVGAAMLVHGRHSLVERTALCRPICTFRGIMLLYNTPLNGVHSGVALVRATGSHPPSPFAFPPFFDLDKCNHFNGL